VVAVTFGVLVVGNSKEGVVFVYRVFHLAIKVERVTGGEGDGGLVFGDEMVECFGAVGALCVMCSAGINPDHLGGIGALNCEVNAEASLFGVVGAEGVVVRIDGQVSILRSEPVSFTGGGGSLVCTHVGTEGCSMLSCLDGATLREEDTGRVFSVLTEEQGG
jgi:hypothetical protein